MSFLDNITEDGEISFEDGDYDDGTAWGDIIDVVNEGGDLSSMDQDVLATIATALEEGDVYFDEDGELPPEAGGIFKKLGKKLKKGAKSVWKHSPPGMIANAIKGKQKKAKGKGKGKKMGGNIDRYGKFSDGGHLAVIHNGRFISEFVPRSVALDGRADDYLRSQNVVPIDLPLSTLTWDPAQGIYTLDQLTFLGAAADPVDVVRVCGIWLKFATPVLQQQAAQFNISFPSVGTPVTPYSQVINDILIGGSSIIEANSNSVEFAMLFPAQRYGKVFPSSLAMKLDAAATLVSIAGPAGFTIYARPLSLALPEAELLNR